MKNRIFISFLSLSILLAAPLCFSSDWPEVPQPPDAKFKIVAEDMVFNGVKMKTWELVSWSPAEKTLNFYRQEWQDPKPDGTPGFIEYQLDDWMVLSRLEGDYQITVQVDTSEKKGSKGLVGISELPAMDEAPVLGRGFPKIGKMQFLNDIRATDQEKKSRTIVAVTDASVKSSVEHFRRTYKRKGWEEQTQNFEYEGQSGFGLMFSKRSKELNVTISEQDNKTNIVAVLVNL